MDANTIKTASQVRAFGPGVYKVHGAECLKRGDADAGSWFYRYGAQGARKVIGLGKALGPNAVTLAEAKAKAAGYSADRAKGIDPKNAIQKADQAASARSIKTTFTFAEFAEKFADDMMTAGNWRGEYARRNWKPTDLSPGCHAAQKKRLEPSSAAAADGPQPRFVPGFQPTGDLFGRLSLGEPGPTNGRKAALVRRSLHAACA
jgi:hypothetical protein